MSASSADPLASPRSIGLIAGGGVFPLRFAEGAKRQGYRVVAVAHEGDADPALEALCDELTWIRLGQLGKMIRVFKKAKVHEAAMAGGVSKARLFGGLRPDLVALKLLPRLRRFDNDSLLRAISDVFESEGIRIVDPLPFCPQMAARRGVYGRWKPDAKTAADIRLGLEISRAIGRADLGQTVCVKGGTVAAVEAMEGTDSCIRRAGSLVGKGVVVVKLAIEGQDLRFDAPSIGPGTIESCAGIGAAALAFEEGRTVILDEAEVIRLADRAKLAVVGVDSGGRWD